MSPTTQLLSKRGKQVGAAAMAASRTLWAGGYPGTACR